VRASRVLGSRLVDAVAEPESREGDDGEAWEDKGEETMT